MQARIQRVFGDAQVGVGHFIVFLAAHGGQENARAVDGDFELMRLLQPRDVAYDVLQQRDAEIILGVQREVVMNQDSAARAQREAFDVILLSADPAGLGPSG